VCTGLLFVCRVSNYFLSLYLNIGGLLKGLVVLESPGKVLEIFCLEKCGNPKLLSYWSNHPAM